MVPQGVCGIWSGTTLRNPEQTKWGRRVEYGKMRVVGERIREQKNIRLPHRLKGPWQVLFYMSTLIVFFHIDHYTLYEVNQNSLFMYIRNDAHQT